MINLVPPLLENNWAFCGCLSIPNSVTGRCSQSTPYIHAKETSWIKEVDRRMLTVYCIDSPVIARAIPPAGKYFFNCSSLCLALILLPCCSAKTMLLCLGSDAAIPRINASSTKTSVYQWSSLLPLFFQLSWLSSSQITSELECTCTVFNVLSHYCKRCKSCAFCIAVIQFYSKAPISSPPPVHHFSWDTERDRHKVTV